MEKYRSFPYFAELKIIKFKYSSKISLNNIHSFELYNNAPHWLLKPPESQINDLGVFCGNYGPDP